MAEVTKLMELEGVVADTAERVAKRDEQVRRDCFALRNTLVRYLTADADAVQFAADAAAINWSTGMPSDSEADHLVKDDLGGITTNMVLSVGTARFILPVALNFDLSAQAWFVSIGTKGKQFRFQDGKRICEWIYQAIKLRVQGASVMTLPMVV